MPDTPGQTAQRYFAAWSQHDQAAILATFAEDGTYAEPATQGPLTSAAIGAHAQRFWAAFPELNTGQAEGFVVLLREADLKA